MANIIDLSMSGSPSEIDDDDGAETESVVTHSQSPMMEVQEGADNQRQHRIEALCRMINATMSVKSEGYLYTFEIAQDVHDDFAIDPYREAIKLGFGTFEAFLYSEYMKNYMEIDSTDGIYSYYAVTTPEQRKACGDVHEEQRTSFLDMEKRRSQRQRATQNVYVSSGELLDDCSPEQFLRRRMLKREGRLVETKEAPRPKKKPQMDKSAFRCKAEQDWEELGNHARSSTNRIRWRLKAPKEKEPSLDDLTATAPSNNHRCPFNAAGFGWSSSMGRKGAAGGRKSLKNDSSKKLKNTTEEDEEALPSTSAAAGEALFLDELSGEELSLGCIWQQQGRKKKKKTTTERNKKAKDSLNSK